METDRRTFLKNAGAMAATALPTRWGATSAQAASGGAGDLAYRSVSELRALLDARKVSAVELLEHTISRIEAMDSRHQCGRRRARL